MTRIRRRAALALLSVVVVASAGPATATDEESRFTAYANSARARAERPAYAVSGELVAVARKHSRTMAARHDLYHNPRLTSEVSNWRAVGENVGRGHTPESLHRALMNSALHRANILDRDFTEIGVGTAYDDQGTLYVTQVFRQPLRAGSRRAVLRQPVRSLPQAARTVVAAAAVPEIPAIVRRLSAARALAAKAAPASAVDHLITYLRVMASLA